MKKLLIVYSSKYGQTKKIADFLEGNAVDLGWQVTILDAKESDVSLRDYMAAIIASPMYAGKYQKSIRRFIVKCRSLLNNMTTVFVSVGVLASQKDEKSKDNLIKTTNSFFSELNWRPDFTEYVAGGLAFKKYNFLIKFIMSRFSRKLNGITDTSRNYDFTDWEQLPSILDKLENA